MEAHHGEKETTRPEAASSAHKDRTLPEAASALIGG
jgi:hypothetical protein